MKHIVLALILSCSTHYILAETWHSSCNQALSELTEFLHNLRLMEQPLTEEQIQYKLAQVKSQMPTDIKNQEHYCSGIIYGIQQAIEGSHTQQ